MEISDNAIEVRRQYKREWRSNNLDHVRSYAREWRKNNPDKVAIHKARYWEKKAKAQNDADN